MIIAISCSLIIFQMASQIHAKRHLYPAENMARAIEAARGGMPKREAARIFQIPRTTLLDKLTGRVDEVCSVGHPTVLTGAEWNDIV